MGVVSRDVKCPFCGAEPRENCVNKEFIPPADMGRFCHLVRWFKAVATVR